MRSSFVVITLALLAASCGSPDKAAQPTGTPTGTSTQSETTSQGSKNVLTGDWPEQVGQADKVQETLSKDGFDCTRSSADFVDLRMCVKSTPPPAPDKGGSSARIRYLADGKGTVVRAAVDGTTDKDGKAMRGTVLKAVLPEPDAAVVEAKGQTLTWGTAKEQQEILHLVVKGGDKAARVLNPISLGTSKEQALPKMQAAGFKCSFDAPIGSTQQTSLSCQMINNEYGQINRTATLIDEGNGLSSVTVKAWQGKTTPENVEALKTIAPPALEVSDDLKDVKAWVEKNLDGREHSAYVGKYIVTVQVSINLMLGNSVSVNVAAEKNEFGATKK